MKLSEKRIKKLSGEVPGWKVRDRKTLRKEFKFGSFRRSIRFVKKVADVAESIDHHPDIHIFYNVVCLEIWTHAVKGLSENDFILAAKIDAVLHPPTQETADVKPRGNGKVSREAKTGDIPPVRVGELIKRKPRLDNPG